MDRERAWAKIRQSIPGLFYDVVKADKLEKQIGLCTPVLADQSCFTPLNELVQHHREIRRLDELIEGQREQNVEKQKEFDLRWNLSYERLIDVNKALDKFSQYHEGCHKKIESTTASLRSTQMTIEDQNREIRKLNKELMKLKQVKKELEKRRNLCESLKDYLNDVVSKQDEHGNIQELIARYEDLKRIRKERCSSTLEGLSRRLDSLLTENHEADRGIMETAAYLSHKATLDKYQDKLLSYNGKMNESLIEIKNSGHSEILQAEHTKLATYTLYLNLCEEMKQTPKLAESDVKGQLEFIHKFLQEMAKIRTRVYEFFRGDSKIVALPDEYLRKDQKQKNAKSSKSANAPGLENAKQNPPLSLTTSQQVDFYLKMSTRSKLYSDRSDSHSFPHSMC